MSEHQLLYQKLTELTRLFLILLFVPYFLITRNDGGAIIILDESAPAYEFSSCFLDFCCLFEAEIIVVMRLIQGCDEGGS